MRVYAIRRKGTDDYLPSRREGKYVVRSGYTHDEPIKGGGEYGPRLFFKELSAERALAAWLQGVWTAKKEFYPFELGEFGPDYDLVVAATPAPDRSRENMEIVPFRLMPIRSRDRAIVNKLTAQAKAYAGSWCSTCERDTQSPMFDGCMLPKCPRGFGPCL